MTLVRAASSLESLDDRLKQLVMLQRFVQLDFLARSISPSRLEKLDAQIAAVRERPDMQFAPISDKRLIVDAVRVWHGDVTQLACDVLVNAIKPTLVFESALHDSIRHGAGPMFDQQLLKLASAQAETFSSPSAETVSSLLPLGATVVTDAFQLTHVRKVLHLCTPSPLEDPDAALLASAYDRMFERFDALCDGELRSSDTDCVDGNQVLVPFTLALPCLAVSVKSFNKVAASAVALQRLRHYLDARLAANRPLPCIALVFFEIETEVVYNRLLPHFFPQ
jgi:O-acetyl-ADP-ribose deacetylase (regulator of RNase III)